MMERQLFLLKVDEEDKVEFKLDGSYNNFRMSSNMLALAQKISINSQVKHFLNSIYACLKFLFIGLSISSSSSSSSCKYVYKRG